MSSLCVINSQIAIGNIFNLVECFTLSTNFKQISPINKEVTGFRIAHIMPLRQLIEEESLT